MGEMRGGKKLGDFGVIVGGYKKLFKVEITIV